MVRAVLAFLVVLVSFATRAEADGVYIPQRAYPALPTIPQQQAVIIYRNGVETLMVESAFRTESPEVAWVLPVPAVPTRVELAEPGAVTSVTASLTPVVHHDLHDLTSSTGVIAGIVAPIALVIIFSRTAEARRRHVRMLLAVMVIMGFLSAILLPSLGSAGGRAVTVSDSVSILSAQRLGNGEFTVLHAATPETLDEWLVSEGMQPLASGRSVVAQYIAEHWCFVVGHLKNAAAEMAVPRPLMVSFPTDAPVFPMRITALAQTKTHVELSVIAEKQAGAAGFHCVAADRFEFAPGQSFDSGRSARYASHATMLAIGHPSLVPLLWDECVATKLTADLAAADMTRDVGISFRPLAEPHRDEVYSASARNQMGWCGVVAGALIILIALSITCHGMRKPSPIVRQLLLGGTVLVGVVVGMIFIAIPVVPVHVEDRAARGMRYQQHSMLRTVIESLAQDGVVHAEMSEQQIAALPQVMLREGRVTAEGLSNPFTGQLIRFESSPGNFALRTIDGDLCLCTYDERGIEYHSRIEFGEKKTRR